MSFCTVLSAAVQGLSVEMIRVEADVSNGLPMFHMVGSADCTGGSGSNELCTGRGTKRCGSDW